jgi:hypothetical protein
MAECFCKALEYVEEDMSLIDDFMDKCIMLNKVTTADGYGGYITTWVDGAEFDAAITFDTSMQARTADKAGVTSLYTVTTTRLLNLEYHDVFRRVRDGKVFRVTSDGDDKFTPASATLDMRQVTAEEWSVTQNE